MVAGPHIMYSASRALRGEEQARGRRLRGAEHGVMRAVNSNEGIPVNQIKNHEKKPKKSQFIRFFASKSEMAGGASGWRDAGRFLSER